MFSARVAFFCSYFLTFLKGKKMADDVVILQDVEVLATNINSYEKNGETKVFRTAYCFLPGDLEGQNKPQVFEMSVETPELLDDLKHMVKKGPQKLASVKRTFGMNSRYIYLDTLAKFLKAS